MGVARSHVRDLMLNTIACSLGSSMANIGACTDAGAALAPLLSGRNRLPCWQSIIIIKPATCRPQLPMDKRYRQVIPYHAVQHATDGIDP